MTLKFLIDECLSPELAALAHQHGFEAAAVRDRGWAGLKDDEVVQRALEHDLVLVTRNARDFRGSSASGKGGRLRAIEVHPGLVCLDSERAEAFDIAKQLRLFEIALAELRGAVGLVNEAVEVVEEEDGATRIDRYLLP